MSYHIQSDKHWRISKSGYSIKTGFADNSRIVASYHAPHTPLDGLRFEQWFEDAQHACDLHNASIDGTARADARIAELERECEQWRDELRIYRETENKRIAGLEQAVTVRDTEIARLETDLELARREIARLGDALDQSALEYADLAVSAKSLEDHLHALVEVSEDSTIARARAVMNGDDIGEDADEDAARAGNGGADD